MKEYRFPAFEELPSIPELPDPFLKPDGTRVKTPEEWPEQREYLKAMLAHYLYGEMPPAPENTSGEVLFSRKCYHGRAIAETVRITFGPGLSFNADILRPACEGRVPVITWNQFKDCSGCPEEEEIVVRRGYAVAEFEKEQLAEDSAKGVAGPLASAYPGYSWGVIAMWAWMQSRLIDYLATTDYADMSKIVATGHSRGGKVALCAGIYDDRIALCAPNGSGCGGAGCFRFLGGRLGEGTAVCETAGSICDAFPFWWADEFAKFGLRSQKWTRSTCGDMGDVLEAMRGMMSVAGKTAHEDKLPFDLHFAKALIAPRALISTDGLSDTWANTFGTQVTWRAAQEVFDFLGVPQNNALHMRDGAHKFQSLDWLAIVDFADSVFFGKEIQNNTVRFVETKEAVPEQLKCALQKMDWRNDKLHYSWSKPQKD